MTQEKTVEMPQLYHLSTVSVRSWSGLGLPIRPQATPHRTHHSKWSFPLGSRHGSGGCQIPVSCKIILLFLSKGRVFSSQCNSIPSLKRSDSWAMREGGWPPAAYTGRGSRQRMDFLMHGKTRGGDGTMFFGVEHFWAKNYSELNFWEIKRQWIHFVISYFRLEHWENFKNFLIWAHFKCISFIFT